MANEFVAAKTQIATVIAGISGIQQAPTNPNETQNVYPFAAIYLASGELGAGPIGTRKSLYNVVIDVFVAREPLGITRALEILDPFIDSVPLALILEVSDGGDKFSNTISTFDSITIQLVPDASYAGVQMIGYRFIMNNVKILSNT